MNDLITILAAIGLFFAGLQFAIILNGDSYAKGYLSRKNEEGRMSEECKRLFEQMFIIPDEFGGVRFETAKFNAVKDKQSKGHNFTVTFKTNR